MARFNIAYDHADARLGHYFQSSKEDIEAFITLHDPSHDIHLIPSVNCTQLYIDGYIPTINARPFLFVAYSHGNDNYLCSGGGCYVLSPDNICHFTNCFFYAMACNSGKTLGVEAIDNGCITYIGFSGTAYALEGDEEQLSIECDNKGLKEFIKGSSASESIILMKDFFKESIRTLLRSKKALAAGYLRHNLASIVLHGDGDVVFTTFN